MCDKLAQENKENSDSNMKTWLDYLEVRLHSSGQALNNGKTIDSDSCEQL
jgi:hypothetical protein